MSNALTSPQPANIQKTPTWELAKTYLDASAGFQRCSVASQVMLGFTLIALHKPYENKGGRPSTRTNATKSTTDESSAEGKGGEKTWNKLLNDRLGMNKMTAFRYMALAKAAKPRIKAMPGLLGLPILDKPITDLSPAERQLLEDGTKKLTDGKSATEFAIECGIMKKPQGYGATGGKRERGEKPTLEETKEAMTQMARDDWDRIHKLLFSDWVKFTLLPDHEVEAQTAVLEGFLKIRREWLRTPNDKRDPKVSDTALKAIFPKE